MRDESIEILNEDKYVIVCVKPVGYLSEKTAETSKEHDMVTALENVYAVHRLDQAVGGVMVYAKTKEMAAKLSEMIQKNDGSFVKEYMAVVSGCPEEQRGVYKDLLFKDSRKNKSFVVKKERKGVKAASLEYDVVKTMDAEKDGKKSLVHIKLHTGRTHQIRVQFASRKMPLAGDGKYGSRVNAKSIGLWSFRITFYHPYEKKIMTFEKNIPEGSPWDF